MAPKSRPTKLTLDEATIERGRELVARYQGGASLSAVVRRSLAALAETWDTIEHDALASQLEIAAMAPFLGTAQRSETTRDKRPE